MKNFVAILIFAFSTVTFSCNQNADLYDVLIQNLSSKDVSGTIAISNEDDKSFSVFAGNSKTIGVSAPYTVSYKNQYGKITGTINYSTNTVVFADNPGIALTLTNNIPKDVYVFTGGYIQGEIVTEGEYKVDGTEGKKINTSATDSLTIFTVTPSFIAKTDDGISVRVSWTIDTTTMTMTGYINY